MVSLLRVDLFLVFDPEYLCDMFFPKRQWYIEEDSTLLYHRYEGLILPFQFEIKAKTLKLQLLYCPSS
jgi:hypothetical protein